MPVSILLQSLNLAKSGPDSKKAEQFRFFNRIDMIFNSEAISSGKLRFLRTPAGKLQSKFCMGKVKEEVKSNPND